MGETCKEGTPSIFRARKDGSYRGKATLLLSPAHDRCMYALGQNESYQGKELLTRPVAILFSPPDELDLHCSMPRSFLGKYETWERI